MADTEPKLREIFSKAIQCQTPEDLVTYLEQACQGNAELRARLEELLQAHREAGSFLQEPFASRPATVDERPISEAPGALVGPYKLLQQIGEGGMGTVFMAEQTEPIERKVALKVIKAGMDSRQVVARFEAERQALAMMDHVNIARVLDAGTTESGRPYFVMELVHGVPITKYCDDHHLTPRQRLELFVPVCQAIQHAHQKGIIHRDIKPSNVMVTLYDGKPVPKVIDFGVAKATEQKLTERTLFTQYGAMVGTLEYMSPEQAEMSALGVDTRSDIYSLGVLLYELLTGTTPLTPKRMKEAAYAEILRMIKEEEPPKPSTRLSDSGEALASISAQRKTEPAKLTKLMRGELDWIVMKCLEKDRNRRYETANGYAADVQRYLNDEAVQACPPSAMYRLRKFARRNKAGLAVAGLILLFFVLLGSGIGWAMRDRAAHQEELARDHATRQAKVAGQVELTLEEAQRLAREEKWPEALVIARRAEAALAGGEADARTQERVREVLGDLVMVQRLEGIRLEGTTVQDVLPQMFSTAGPRYAAAFAEYGLNIEKLTVQEAAARIRSRPEVVVALVAALSDWAFVRGETDEAAGRRLTALAQAADPDPWRQRVRDALLRKDWKSLEELAASEEMRRQPAATLFLLGLALHNRGNSVGEDVLRRAQREYPNDFWINYRLGLWLIWKGRPQTPRTEEGIGYMRVAVALRPQSALAWINLGVGFFFLKRHDEAIACQRKAIELAPQSAGANSNLGLVLRDEGKLDEAIACFRKAIELDPKRDGRTNLGAALREQGKLDEAIAVYRKAIELDPKLAAAHVGLGAALREQGKLNEAIAASRKAIELDPKLAAAHVGLGIALSNQKKLEEAIACFRKAIELDPKYAIAHNNLGVALRDRGKLEEAIACYRKAIELDPKYAGAHNSLGVALRDQGKLDEAVAAYRKAIEFDPKFAMAHRNLGAALYEQGKLGEAFGALRKAIELDPKDAMGHNNLGYFLMKKGQLAEALACYKDALRLKPDLRVALANLANLGNALKEQGRLDDAIGCYRKAIELDPKFTIAHNNLGVALKDQGKLDEAVAAYRKAIELDPKFAMAHVNLGCALYKQGKPDEAIACFRKAIALDPKLAVAHNHLGIALSQHGKPAEAIACFRTAIEIDPKRADPHNNLAWLLATAPDLKLRDPKRAVQLAAKAVELDPKNVGYPNTLGVAHYRAGDWKAAVASLEKSMELRHGGDSNDWLFLAMAHWRLGDKVEARKWYDRAVAWMDKNQPKDEELLRFRKEAAELLKIDDPPKPVSKLK